MDESGSIKQHNHEKEKKFVRLVSFLYRVYGAVLKSVRHGGLKNG